MPVTFCENGYILHEKAQIYSAGGRGWLSIKSFAGGRAHYEVGQNRYAVDDRQYLLLNNGQAYHIDIAADTRVESFCIFFAPRFAEATRQGLTLPDDRLLDTPTSLTPILFFDKTYPHDSVLTPGLRQLRSTLSDGTTQTIGLDEQFIALMGRLLQVHFNVYKAVEALPAARPATREELYRRVSYARDYAAALFDTDVTLQALADVACLSPNHLLRTFKQVFHQTPHQFITSLRLEEAQRLLRDTNLPITEICYRVGFSSPGAFGWLFQRHVGTSPGAYRRQTRQ